MVASVEVDTSQAKVRVVDLATSVSAKTSLASTVAVYNFPSQEINNSEVKVFVPSTRQSEDAVRATNARVFAVVKGRSAQPRIKTWTFTLDGHDFYILQLQDETLVYDLSTQQWHVWGSGSSPSWRAIHGINWKAPLNFTLSTLGGEVVSNVLVGDDTTGALYFLAPEKAEDDFGDETKAGLSNPFMRVVHAQIVHRGRDVYPLNGVLLTGSVGDVNSASNLSVNLSYSDDRGHTYNDAANVSIIPDDYSTRVEWRSLGTVKQPGRLMKITDYGGLVRIDGLDIPDEQS